MAKNNVILVTVDCLRADHLNCYGYERKTMPFIDYLSTQGVKFEKFFATGHNTCSTFPSIFASVYPLELTSWLPLPQDIVLVSEILRQKGVKTAAVHSNPYLSSFYGYNRGWDYFQDFLENENKHIKQFLVRKKLRNLIRKCTSERTQKSIRELHQCIKILCNLEQHPYELASTITNCALSWLNKNKDSQFFLWIHYMDAHEPYWIRIGDNFEQKYSRGLSRFSRISILRDNIRGSLRWKTVQRMIDIYDDKLRYIDANLKKLFDFLDEKKLLDNTYIIFTADHGQEFLEHGGLFHNAPFLYDEILHVPLILIGPDIEKYADKNLISQIDIAPTILDLFMLPLPKFYRGLGVLSTSIRKRKYVISEAVKSGYRTYAVRTEKWKLIYNPKRQELYDLERDPKETKNVKDEEKEEYKNLLAILNRHILWEEKIRIQRATILEKQRIIRKLRKIRF